MNTITFGELVRKKRKDLGLPIREVAARLELDQSVWSKIERGLMQAPAKVVTILADTLQLDYRELQKKYWSERIYNEIKNQDYAVEALEMALKRAEKNKLSSSEILTNDQLVARLTSFFKEQPILKAWLFGSFVRNEASLDSDIDLLIRFDASQTIDLFDYIGMKQSLEDLTGRSVDLVEEGQEAAAIKPFIEREKKLIYER